MTKTEELSILAIEACATIVLAVRRQRYAEAAKYAEALLSISEKVRRESLVLEERIREDEL